MATNEIISPYFENGVFAGVRVTLGDEDFVIAPKDYQGGEGMNWHSAMDALNADNLSTWSGRQVRLTMAYRKEVDKALKDNGGDNLEDCYWTCVENSECSSFIYFGINNTMDIINKLNSCVVRPIKNLKK